MQHGGAGVNSIGAEMGTGCEELGEETSVPIAEDKDALLLEEAGEEVQPAAFEGAAEGEIFEPPVRAGYRVEVGFWLHR